MTFNESVKFYGTYRPYQQRVLDNLVAFLDNEKIHIVAAPGSGKTILGLELIKRLDNPALILAPSIAIREQWIERFSNGFLNNPDEKDLWISNDLHIQRPIICITYQAFYSAYKKEKSVEENEEEIDEETIDYTSFDLLDTINKYNIKTICLDECHHLKSEWWKALENTIKKIEGVSLIALTATPPYDSTYLEWQRYINLCGPIDEEIFVPELIKDKNICPHQDYVYFSYPTKEEEKSILRSYSNGIKIFHKYKNHPKIVEIVESNKVYKDYNKFKKTYYDNQEYYTALILFLIENKVKVPFKVRLLIDKEKFSIQHFETLLQCVLFDDTTSYKKDDLLFSMKKEFSALGIVHNRKLSLVHDERLNKTFAMSLSKLESIKEIVKNELYTLKNDLKCLILTDYIKLKTKNYIGTSKKIDAFGTIPIFEYLRRSAIEGIKLACLSGSICVVPVECKKDLIEFEFSDLLDENYVEVLVNKANRKNIVLKITELLKQGKINVLVGTKSLLGEGWDSPCINSLIMASFIGSYVLSNQMRGRAIRTDKDDPNKKSNVWHLVCLNPYDYRFSTDYYNLQKRLSTFVGVNVKKKTIESGIERLGFKRMPVSEFEANKSNNNTLIQSKNRELIKTTWEKCIKGAKSLDTLTKVTTISRRRLRKDYSFYSSLAIVLLTLSIFTADIGLYKNLVNIGTPSFVAHTLSTLLLSFFAILFLISAHYLINLINPERKLKSIGKATLKAMIKSKNINSKKVRVKTFRRFNKTSIYLKNATTYEQNLFSDAITQILGRINQPRYIIALPKFGFKAEYYVVPEMFKKNKQIAKIFVKQMRLKVGLFKLIFAKNEEGKNEVIKAYKFYYVKYKKVDIDTKYILLTRKIK